MLKHSRSRTTAGVNGFVAILNGITGFRMTPLAFEIGDGFLLDALEHARRNIWRLPLSHLHIAA